jgi:hypothetical protein
MVFRGTFLFSALHNEGLAETSVCSEGRPVTVFCHSLCTSTLPHNVVFFSFVHYFSSLSHLLLSHTSPHVRNNKMNSSKISSTESYIIISQQGNWPWCRCRYK